MLCEFFEFWKVFMRLIKNSGIKKNSTKLLNN